MSALLVLVLLSQANGAHEALDALDRLRLPTSAAVAASQTPEGAASLGFDATQVRLIEHGSLDATLRLGVMLAVGSTLVSGSAVGTSLSPSPWLVGATTGAVTLGVVSLLHFLWGARGGTDVFRAFELRNDARVTDARARWAEPGLARVTERLLLLGRAGSSYRAKQGVHSLDDDALEALFSRDDASLLPDFERHRALAAGSKVLQFSALVPLGVAPLLVAATGAALVAVVAISVGSALLSVGLMTAGVLVGGAANDLYFSVMQRWNERILNETRRGLPLRLPEPEPPALQEPPSEPPPPVVVPPSTDTPRRQLILPGVVPTTKSQ